jgi:hypothetical protein
MPDVWFYSIVTFNGSAVLHGYKDAATDLWTLPINVCRKIRTALSQLAPVLDCDPHICPDFHLRVDLASFTHSVCTHANGVNFAHQSLCNLKISTLLKAVCPKLAK